jgi:hypothetical protein
VLLSLQQYRLRFVCISHLFVVTAVSLNNFVTPYLYLCVVVVVSGGGGGGFLGGYETVPPSKRSRYSDWLRAGRPRGRSSIFGVVKNVHFSLSCRPALGPTKPPIQWVPGSFPGGKVAVAWSWPLTSNYCRGQENVDLYMHSLICLHGVVLN